MMPRNKRRQQRSYASTEDRSSSRQQLSAAVRSETRKLAETLIQVTSSRTGAAEAFPELFRLTSQLSDLQKELGFRPRTDETERQEAAQALLAVMTARGVDCSRLGVALFPGQGLGLTARRPVSANEVLLELPRSLMMASEDAFESSIADFLRADPICQGMPSMALSVFLLHETALQHKSEWREYIASLPSSFSNCLYFTPADIRLLKGSSAQERAAADFRRICRQYAFFFLQLEKGKEAELLSFRDCFTFDDFRWAVGAVMSRNNPVPQKTQMGASLGLIPVWDLGNHKFGSMTTDFDSDSLLLRFHAMEDASEDGQILFHYGDRSNLDLLLYAGFTVPDNRFDRCSVRLGISDKDPLSLQRRTILEMLGLGVTETFYLDTANENLPPPLIAFVRVFVMTSDELDAMSDSCSDLPRLAAALLHPGLGDAAQSGLDERAARFLHTRFSLLLAALTRQHDEESPQAAFIRVLIDSETALIKKAISQIDAKMTAKT